MNRKKCVFTWLLLLFGLLANAQTKLVYGNIACVKNDAFDLIDYLQLGKCNGEWRIINVLWAMKANR